MERLPENLENYGNCIKYNDYKLQKIYNMLDRIKKRFMS